MTVFLAGFVLSFGQATTQGNYEDVIIGAVGGAITEIAARDS